jgi:hypothetical protein
MLEVDPGVIPDFVKKYKDAYMDKTREWLKDYYNKGIVYIPMREFMENGELRFNSSMAPMGYSIGYVAMLADGMAHVIICKDGKVEWDNDDNGKHETYDVLMGYFIIYDLELKSMRRSIIESKKQKKKTTKK